ncbi:MAG: NACHT domain-containing protein, partial [Actinomycetota bacterium]|nr:NACHT domain-containing protein [Actinomycetota bacterium]
MLFERWDRSRGIHYTLPFVAHVRPTMTYLAHWIYSDEALQGGATEQQLVTKATEYLYPDHFENRDEAEMAAREFIEFCRGRAWVFTDTGTTARGDRLYQFTHRTFLEYFTASYLTRTYYTPDKLVEVLLPRISRREWDIVAQLAFQIQSETATGAGDELLTALIEKANKDQGEESWKFLSFAA